MRQVILDVQLIEGNCAVPSAVRRSRVYDAEVRSWHQLKTKKFITPFIEDFYGGKVRSMEIGDLCEMGPFWTVEFRNGEEQNINICCVDANDGDDIYDR